VTATVLGALNNDTMRAAGGCATHSATSIAIGTWMRVFA
jgi:hypothetical protein